MASKIKHLLHMDKKEEVPTSHAAPASTMATAGTTQPMGASVPATTATTRAPAQAMPMGTAAAVPATRGMAQRDTMQHTNTTSTMASNQQLLDEGDAFLSSMKGFTPTIRRYVETNDSFTNELGNFVQKAPTPRRHQHALFSGMDMQAGQAGSMLPPQQNLVSGTHSSGMSRMEQEMLQPLNEWEHAYDSAKERMSDLERLRMQYDAASRKFQSVYAQTQTTITTTDQTGSRTQTEIDSESMQSAKHAARLAHLKAKYGPGMEEYQSLVSQLNIHLNWLVDEAQRIKAYYASILDRFRESSISGKSGLLLPFPQGVLSPFPDDLWANGRDDGYDEAEWLRINMPPPPPQLVQVPVAVVMKDVEVAGPEVTVQEEGVWRDEGMEGCSGRTGSFEEPATQRLRNSLNDMTMGGERMPRGAGTQMPRGAGTQL